jgi:hypothetical protein
LKGLLLEPDFVTILAQLRGSKIQLKIAKTNCGIRGSAPTGLKFLFHVGSFRSRTRMKVYHVFGPSI